MHANIKELRSISSYIIDKHEMLFEKLVINKFFQN